MDALVPILAALAGLAAGALIAGLLLGRRARAAEDALATLREARARLESDLDNERRAAGDRAALLEQAETKLREAFRALSADALENSQRSFLELARGSLEGLQKRAVEDMDSRRQAVDALVKPIEEALGKVDERMREAEKDRAGAYAALRQQVEGMARTQQQLQGETARLVQALRAPAVRGRWGEIQLRRVVEMAGMVEHCDFFEQQTADADQGRLRPDLLVRLPGDKHVVVDAKAPLAAYLEALDAPDDATREARMRDHARQVREHMAKLGAKAYWEQFQPTPEFVVMFLPGETFFSAALQHDPGLIEFGVDRFVIPASPTTLIALLRAVHYGWQQERLAENAERIRDLGRALHDRLRTLADHFEKMRRGLDSAVNAYNAAVGSFESRVLVAARQLKELGTGAREDLPPVGVVDRATRALQSDEPE